MFTFLKYQLPVERETEDDKGGGYLVFTTQLVEDGDFLETKVKPKLADRMRAERPNDPPAAAAEAHRDRLRHRCVRRLLIMKDDKFVGTVQAGKPSMFADNSASFAVELKDLGAELALPGDEEGRWRGRRRVRPRVRDPAAGSACLRALRRLEVKDVPMTYTTSQIHDEDTWGNETTTTEAHRTSISRDDGVWGLITLNIDKGSSQIGRRGRRGAARVRVQQASTGGSRDHFSRAAASPPTRTARARG